MAPTMQLSDDDFTLFGLPQRHALDAAALADQWRALQSQVHPDRFASEGASAQRLAMQWAVRVNEAYQRLKDPLKRAAYLCELAGQPINAENNTAMPGAFLMQQMEWREALDDAHDAQQIDALGLVVKNAERDALAQCAALLDEAHDHAGAAQQVRALMFLARFARSVEQRADQLGQ